MSTNFPPPFHLWVAGQPPEGFDDLEEARAHGTRLLNRGVEAVITDATGRLVSTFEVRP